MSFNDLILRHIVVSLNEGSQDKVRELCDHLIQARLCGPLDVVLPRNLVVYEGIFPRGQAQELKTRLQTILGCFNKPVDVLFGGYSTFQSLVMWQALPTPALNNFQQALLEAVDEVREGLVIPKYAHWLTRLGSDVDAPRRRAIGRYGSPFLGQETGCAYVPLTLCLDTSAALHILPEVQGDLVISSVKLVDPYDNDPNMAGDTFSMDLAR